MPKCTNADLYSHLRTSTTPIIPTLSYSAFSCSWLNAARMPGDITVPSLTSIPTNAISVLLSSARVRCEKVFRSWTSRRMLRAISTTITPYPYLTKNGLRQFWAIRFAITDLGVPRYRFLPIKIWNRGQRKLCLLYKILSLHFFGPLGWPFFAILPSSLVGAFTNLLGLTIPISFRPCTA